ncbi:hypothetical protein M441DRAFT_458389, partial [Trichoderma asperellum CBS 433.97]
KKRYLSLPPAIPHKDVLRPSGFAVVICKRSSPPQRGPANLDSLLQQPFRLFRRIDKKECLSAFSCSVLFSSLWLAIPSIFFSHLYFLLPSLGLLSLQQVPKRAIPDLGPHTLLAAAPPLTNLTHTHARRLNSSETVLSGIYKQPSLLSALAIDIRNRQHRNFPFCGFSPAERRAQIPRISRIIVSRYSPSFALPSAV